MILFYLHTVCLFSYVTIEMGVLFVYFDIVFVFLSYRSWNIHSMYDLENHGLHDTG